MSRCAFRRSRLERSTGIQNDPLAIGVFTSGGSVQNGARAQKWMRTWMSETLSHESFLSLKSARFRDLSY